MLTTSTMINNSLGEEESKQYGATRITVAVKRANAETEAYCRRTFEATNYLSWMPIKGGCVILPQYPLISINRLTVNTSDNMSLTNTNDNYSANIINGVINLNVQGLATDSLTLSEYATLDALGIAIAALAGKGWSYNVTTEDLPTNLRPMFSSSNVAGGSIYLQSPYGYGEYYPDPVEQSIINVYSSCALAFVSYRAGYEDGFLPDDLTGIVTDYAIDILRNACRDQALKKEKIGDYSYELRDDAGVNIFEPFKKKLSIYRRMIV